MQILSSKLTFFYKYVVLLIWTAGFALGTRAVLFHEPFFDGRWFEYFLSLVAVAIFIIFSTGSILQVRIDRKNSRLEASNYFKTVLIAFTDIEDIDGTSVLSPKLVWFSLKKDTALGRKITFMPAKRMTRPIGRHPLVMELRQEFNLDVRLTDD